MFIGGTNSVKKHQEEKKRIIASHNTYLADHNYGYHVRNRCLFNLSPDKYL